MNTAAAAIRALEKRIEAFAPPPGVVGSSSASSSKSKSKSKDEDEEEEETSKFKSLPISPETLQGLARGKFSRMTDIQRLAIPHALASRDILGAAKTGSGKTLAYLVPLVEDLYRAQWSRDDKVGALVISPTRELALQIFEVLRVIAFQHVFTSCLLIGGTEFAKEQRKAARIQIAVCTPGRLLQHLEQNPAFDVTNLRVLVLDEADRLLDLGFSEQLEAILTYLPEPRSKGGERQTMLFSATQTKQVSDLAKLSLSSDAEFISVHSNDKLATPASLKQSYVVSPLPLKLDLLWNFIKSHLKNKTIVFFSSCSQVRFVDAAFRRFQPGVSIMALHGKIKPVKRTLVYQDFISKPAAVLFATDIAARGLDFPSVDWVVQMDCPEDTASYIHRVGRTARYNQGGNALLVLLPTEVGGVLPQLELAKVPIKKISINPEKGSISIQDKLRATLASDTELKSRAQKAFKSYLRSVHLQSDKQVFDVKKLPISEYAASLGLPSAPRIKFLEGEKLREVKNQSKKLMAILAEEDENERKEVETPKRKKLTKMERLLKRQSQQIGTVQVRADGTDDGLVPVVKKTAKAVVETLDEETTSGTPAALASKQPKKKKPIKISASGVVKGSVKPTRTVFDEEGAAEDPFESLVRGKRQEQEDEQTQDDFVSRMAKRLREEDAKDKENERKRVKEMHREKKRKLKAAGGDAGSSVGVQLGAPDESGGEEGDEEAEEGDVTNTEEEALRLIRKQQRLR